MPSTIRDLTELTAVASDDYLLISDTSDVTNRDKRISRANLLGTAVFGSGTPAAGNVARWLTATTIDDTLIPYNDISRLSTAQSISALKTFNAGVAFGSSPQTTLSYFGVGSWAPVVRDATSGGNVASVGSATGWWARVGALVFAALNIQNINTAGMTAANTLYITGLPFAARTATNYQAHTMVQANFFTFTQQILAVIASGNTYCLFAENVSGANPAIKTVATITSTGADCLFGLTYLTD